MASPTPRNSAGSRDPAKALTFLSSNFVDNVKKNKHDFFQFIAVTGILLMSCQSLSQKHLVHDLEEDTEALRQERDSLAERMRHIKGSLLREASIDSTGAFAARLRQLFGGDDQ
ncbi:PREDICTED: uncharacterized protein LOC104811451 [Tarenaya hassleriana]|uniref:uncharacterized protein LOC104811451 n=1 Tax=Tarenaya hassleriana TaxID=28532 RepID=UPI00053C5706|nr:PREDICTED: uncharacterized protein LOC104811451 [Tarenaya hassleriana]